MTITYSIQKYRYLQELILRAFERIKNEDSTDVMETLDESRSLLRSSLEDFRREQDEYRQQLEELKRYKELTMQRRKGTFDLFSV